MFSIVIKKARKTTSVILVLALIAASVSGCAYFGAAQTETEDPQTGTEDPEVLRLALIPAEDIIEMMDAFEPTRQHLENELGIKIEMYQAIDYTAVIEAMRAGKIELAFFGPFSYVLAAERANARAIIAGGDADGNLAVYHSIMIAHKDSNLQDIDDIKARADELAISFVDPASTSGYLIPYGFMKSIGISPDEAFREIIFAGGHDASILAVSSKKVDFGATWEGPYQKAIDEGLITAEDVPVIWRSEGIPRSPLAVRGDLSESLIERIQQVFLDMPQKAPAAFEQWEGRWEGNESYVPVSDEVYEFIRDVARGLGKI